MSQVGESRGNAIDTGSGAIRDPLEVARNHRQRVQGPPRRLRSRILAELESRDFWTRFYIACALLAAPRWSDGHLVECGCPDGEPHKFMCIDRGCQQLEDLER
jgi:hypothetical protein